MLRLIVLLALAVCVSASTLSLFGGRIVNGTAAKPGEIPSIISLRLYESHNCGGSILDPTHILTAAHCVDGYSPSTLSVQYGLTRITNDDSQVIQVLQKYVHEGWQYNPSTGYPNDVAVLKLESPIPLSENAAVAILPEQDEEPPAGEYATVAGWGYTASGGTLPKDLQKVQIVVYTDQQCKDGYGSRVSSEYHVCAAIPEGGQGECNGDSGGPLIAPNGVQIGTVSWSVKPCASLGNPGVFARVARYVDWIKDKMQL